MTARDLNYAIRGAEGDLTTPYTKRSGENLSSTVGDPIPPSNVTPVLSLATQTSLAITWTASTDDQTPQTAIVYEVFFALFSGSINYSASPATVTVGGATSATITGLVPSTSYRVAVLARDRASNRSTAIEVQMDTLADSTAPTFAGATSATVSATPGIIIRWSPATDTITASQSILYRIYRATTPGGQNFASPYDSVTGRTSYEDTSVSNGQNYYYVVRARDAAGNEDTNTTEVFATAYTPVYKFTGYCTTHSTWETWERTSASAAPPGGHTFSVIYYTHTQ